MPNSTHSGQYPKALRCPHPVLLIPFVEKRVHPVPVIECSMLDLRAWSGRQLNW
jgi:hypothetical protein